MAWVVDTCLIIDVLDADPDFAQSSASLLDAHAADGLVICPVTFVELAPAFLGNIEREEHFLQQINVRYTVDWAWADTEAAHHAWQFYVAEKRNGKLGKRPIADIQIGAFATRFAGLLTRNGQDFLPVFPDLCIRAPLQG